MRGSFLLKGFMPLQFLRLAVHMFQTTIENNVIHLPQISTGISLRICISRISIMWTSHEFPHAVLLMPMDIPLGESAPPPKIGLPKAGVGRLFPYSLRTRTTY